MVSTETDRIETELGQLAARWRGSENQIQATEIQDQYVALLLLLLEANNWQGPLDVDAELPDELMPNEYFAKFQPAQPSQY